MASGQRKFQTETLPYSEKGKSDLLDPWGNPFRFLYVVDPRTGTEQFVAWTVNPQTGKVLAFPRELIELIGK